MSQLNKPTLTLALKEDALKFIFKSYEIKCVSDIDLKNYLEMASSHIESQIKEELIKDESSKIEMSVGVNLVRRSDGEIIKAKPFFTSGLNIFTAGRNIAEVYKEMTQK